MIDISLNKISKSYGSYKVLDDLSFVIKNNEKVALIGSNGCGKTTTLRLIMGLDSIDSGNIEFRKNISIGYLTQIPLLEDDSVTANEVFLRGVKDLIDLECKIKDFINNMNTDEKSIKLLNQMQENYRILGGYNLNERIEKIKYGFKISNEILNTKYNNLSGGEKTIVNLASLMLSNKDVLLLDEPTNHLDIETLEWFEDYIKEYKGSVLIVSHDRYFLDKVVNKIIFLDNGKCSIYYGNYSYYLKESEKQLMLQFKSYKNQQKEIKAIKEAILRYKEWGNKGDNPIFFRRANALQKRLDNIELIDKPHIKKELTIDLQFDNRSGNHVLDLINFTLSIDNKLLIDNSNMYIYYKEKVCLMGKNGSGKTTLIKNIINNTHENIKIGTNVVIGYIPQEIRFVNENLTVYEYMKQISSLNETQLRSKLSRFYFDENGINKKLNSISGGEKVRIKLLELILKKANFLILDEPTNHIDIDTREILEDSLLEFDGTILFISHDRYFINKICNRIIRIENKKLVSYDGNYDSIKNKKVEIDIPKIEEKITIKGSNRLNEFIKDATRIELLKSINDYKLYKIRKKSKIYYLKEANHLSKESIILDYLEDKLKIPKKIFYEKYNNKSYLLLNEIRGNNLINFEKDKGIDIIIEAFNSLYSVNYSDCIFDETIMSKIKRIESNKIKLNDDLMKRFYTFENVIKYLKGNIPKQIIGFTHGNFSLENIIEFDNHFAGFINNNECGIGDIYYDIVTCELSIEKYYGKEYVDIFYDKIGIEKDLFKSDYYRVLLSLR